jgi:hypothetical protein
MASIVGTWRFLFSVSLTCTHSAWLLGRGISPTQGLYLQRTTQTQNKRTTQTCMPRVRFKPMMSVLGQEKTADPVDRSAMVISGMKTRGGGGEYSCAILGLDTRRSCVVSFKSRVTPLDTTLGGRQRQSASCDEQRAVPLQGSSHASM